MGQLARNAHEANICLQDLYIWHVYIYEDSLEGDVRLSVIDLHRMLRNIENPRKKIADLGALYWSMSSEYFDEGHKDLLVETYACGGSGEKSAILRDIEKRAAVLDRRRILKNHYERARRGLGLD